MEDLPERLLSLLLFEDEALVPLLLLFDEPELDLTVLLSVLLREELDPDLTVVLSLLLPEVEVVPELDLTVLLSVLLREELDPDLTVALSLLLPEAEVAPELDLTVLLSVLLREELEPDLTVVLSLLLPEEPVFSGDLTVELRFEEDVPLREVVPSETRASLFLPEELPPLTEDLEPELLPLFASGLYTLTVLLLTLVALPERLTLLSSRRTVVVLPDSRSYSLTLGPL